MSTTFLSSVSIANQPPLFLMSAALIAFAALANIYFTGSLPGLITQGKYNLGNFHRSAFITKTQLRADTMNCKMPPGFNGIDNSISSLYFNLEFELKLVIKFFLTTTLFLGAYRSVLSQNYDESNVPNYALPELLLMQNGARVERVEQWENTRRNEVLDLFKQHVYGDFPSSLPKPTFQVVEEDREAFCGIAIRKQVKMLFTDGRDTIVANLLIYLPKTVKKPIPIFIGLNFFGNHTVHADPNIFVNAKWVKNKAEFDIFHNEAGPEQRGVRSHRWPIERIIERGYGLATIYYGDLFPDHSGKASEGLPRFISDAEKNWGAIGIWAYGLSCAMDYFEKDEAIDHEKVAVMGHSRLGKTSLWAGAMDERFALVISNNSGCGGAAIFRRKYGETIQMINQKFPHWFNDKFKEYNREEGKLPIDQHMLLALIAPRPLYVASAKKDRYADPKGEFLSAFHASEVYQLYELKGIKTAELPAINEAITGSHVGYHIRSGIHDVTRFDWERFMDFADYHFKNTD